MPQDSGFRTLTTEAALSKIVAAVDRQGFTADVAVADGDVSAAFVSLREGGIEVTRGMGKGAPLEALTGGYFESMEHFATAKQQYGHGFAVYRPSEYFMADGRLEGDRALQILADMPGIQVACSTLSCLYSGAKVLYPAFLTDPHLDPAKLEHDISILQHLASVRRYSSNNGAAIGCSDEEAMLHGINEVVERDLLSRAMVSRAFCVSTEVGLVTDLPADLRSLVEAAEDVTGDRIAILLLSGPGELPTFLAMHHTEDGISPLGSGSSLCPFRAFRRAVTEYVQCCVSRERAPNGREGIAQAIGRLVDYEKLASVVAPRWPDFGRSGLKVVPLSFAQICAQHIPVKVDRLPKSVTACLSTTLRVARVSYTSILAGTIAEFGDGIVVKQIVIPQADRFFMISSGIPIMPSQRHCPIAA
jgi:ribosomal protein S12 methylthiotransferase accessory factor